MRHMNPEEGGGASRSTDPAFGTSSATDVSLREHLTGLIENSRRECKANVDSLRAQMLEAQKTNVEAIKVALISIDKRFESVNEFRAALNDLSNRMATQDSVQNLADKVVAGDEALEARFEALYQRNRDDISTIAKRLDLAQGEMSGSRLTKATLYTVISIAVGALGLLVFVANYMTTH